MSFSDNSDIEVAAVVVMEEVGMDRDGVGMDRDGVESGTRVDMATPPRFRRCLERLIWRRRWLKRDLWIV